MELADLLAIVVSLFDAAGQGLAALAMGFTSAPTGIGFLVAAVLIFSFGTVGLVGFEAESLTIVSRIAKREWKTMVQIVLTAGIIGAILGFFELFGAIVNFIDGPILAGMMTGVGVILAFVGIDLAKDNKIIGLCSIGAAMITYLLLRHDENGLIYGFAACFLVSIIVSRFVPFTPIISEYKKEKIQLIPLEGFRFLKNPIVIRGALALLALRTGTSIAYMGINEQISGQAINVDHMNIISGIAGAASGLFGGAPMEPLISLSAASPTPNLTTPIFVAIAGILLIFGVLPRIARHVPLTAIAGILFLLGAGIAIPENISYVISDTDMVSGPVTLVVTAATMDPFMGMVAGVITRFILGIEIM